MDMVDPRSGSLVESFFTIMAMAEAISRSEGARFILPGGFGNGFD